MHQGMLLLLGVHPLTFDMPKHDCEVDGTTYFSNVFRLVLGGLLVL